MKLYQCFHDHGSRPDPKYISAIRPELLCGSSATHRNTDDITGCLRDDNGDNISAKNPEYSELTGLYWAWQNQRDEDIIGLEHYRRHFIRHDAKIDNYVHPEDLITEQEIRDLLNINQFIIPVHEELFNTSVYDLYVICFHEEETNNFVKYMLKFWDTDERMKKEILKCFSENWLGRGNLMIASQLNMDEYCRNLFGMLFWMEENMPVINSDRIWGYISEIFPIIWLRAKGKKFVEVDVAVDDENWETHEKYVHTTQNNEKATFDKNPKEQIEYFLSL